MLFVCLCLSVCPPVRLSGRPLCPLCVICCVLSLDLIRPLPTSTLSTLRSAVGKWSIPKCCPPTNRCHNNAPEVRRTQDAMANGRNDSVSCRNCCRQPPPAPGAAPAPVHCSPHYPFIVAFVAVAAGCYYF